MAFGKNEKMSVGFGELSRDTIVSLAACDLHNASREADSIELLDNASLSARSIFLSGGYALAVGAIMIASRYLTTHTSPVADQLLATMSAGPANREVLGRLKGGKTG